jgi:aldehyde:ferredoxin oxidoreductase
MAHGYTGKILRVNLSTGESTIDEHDEVWYRTYFGGRGIILYYLLKELQPRTDPLSPQNKLIFAPGILTGVPVAGCGRNSVGGKSPLTGAYGEAEVGGFFGAELKHAGFDAVVVDGQAESPVYIWVHDGQVEIRDAKQLWGKNVLESHVGICEEWGDNGIRTAQIGPAGERLVRFACVINDSRHAAGRAGLGAVMGSKKLKAVAVRGHGKLDLADPQKVRQEARWMVDHWKELAGALRDHGTAINVMGLNAAGALPTRNFREGVFEGAERISGEAMTESILKDRGSCYACPIQCKRVVQAKVPYDVNPLYGGPEYETIAALGSLCGVDDLVAIAKGHELCDAYSLDTISTGTTIAFAMECFENGLLSKSDTGGIELRFGNAEAMVEMVNMIAKRQMIGNLLAEGLGRASQDLGADAAQYAMQVKGQPFPLHEPRFKQGMGMMYAVSPTGACHVAAFHDSDFEGEGWGLDSLRAVGILQPLPTTELSPRKVRSMVYSQHWYSFANSAVYCVNVPYNLNQLAEIAAGVTGWNTNVWELLKIGERGTTLARVFNVREGFTSEHDWLPGRMFQPLPAGPLKGVAIAPEQLGEAVKYYYGMMGWNDAGIPGLAKLAELDVDWAASPGQNAPCGGGWNVHT